MSPTLPETSSLPSQSPSQSPSLSQSPSQSPSQSLYYRALDASIDGTTPARAVTPLRLLQSSAIRALESATHAKAMDPHPLMAAAGRAAAQFVLAASVVQAAQRRGERARIWCVAGPGNNGGDALCTGVELAAQGLDVRICLPVTPRDDGGSRAAYWAWQRALQAGLSTRLSIQTALPSGDEWTHAEAWVDGLFGIGINRPLSNDFATLAWQLSERTRAGHFVLALDVPSGLNADTGAICSASTDTAAPSASHERHRIVEASHTLSFLAPTPGLFTGQGPNYAGEIWIAELHNAATAAMAAPHSSQPASADVHITDVHIADVRMSVPALSDATLCLNTPHGFAPSLPRRRAASHKGTFGSLAVVGGDTGTCGAVILAARAALYLGAGRVHAALIGPGGPAYDPPHPEIMIRDVTALALDTMDATAIGPGLGKSERAADILRRVIALGSPLLIDADGLNLLATHDDLRVRVLQHPETILTPHPGEAARLLQTHVANIEADRLGAARKLAERFGAVIVLKGAGTVIQAPDGRCAINVTGNTGLATGGTGDVLSGVTGAMLAQGLAPYEAALAATYLHGWAAQRLARDGIGPAGLSAGELAPAMRSCLNDLLHEYRLIVEPGRQPFIDILRHDS